MKKLFILLIGVLITVSGFAQYGQNIYVDADKSTSKVWLLLSTNGKDPFTGRTKRLTRYETKGTFACVDWEKMKTAIIDDANIEANDAIIDSMNAIIALLRAEISDSLATVGGVGYKEYVAFVSQSGTSAPTAVILHNTLTLPIDIFGYIFVEITTCP